MGKIRIFPPLVENHPVVHDDGVPVAVLVKCELPGLFRFWIVGEQSAHFVHSIGTGKAQKGGRGTENIRTIGRVTTIETIKVLVFGRRELSDCLVIEIQLEEVPSVFRPNG